MTSEIVKNCWNGLQLLELFRKTNISQQNNPEKFYCVSNSVKISLTCLQATGCSGSMLIKNTILAHFENCSLKYIWRKSETYELYRLFFRRLILALAL